MSDPPAHSSSALDPRPHVAWLIDAGLADVGVAELWGQLCDRVVAGGLPLRRGYISFAALHPVQWASGILWQHGRVVDAVDMPHGYDRERVWHESPLRYLIESGKPRLRCRLDHPSLDFPVFDEFREARFTDWLALLSSFGWPVDINPLGALGVVTTWTTDQAGGWTDAELNAIETIARPLALAVKAISGRTTARQLLAAYLGRDSAERVVAGRVRRGSVECIYAVVLYADLRGFTNFAERAAPEEVTRRLNAAFDAIGGPVAARGGEILKFLGDGVLAIFRADDERGTALIAAEALSAAREILAGISRLNRSEAAGDNPPLLADIALHAGEVTYGNVGAAERLDFTVIGPVVNQAARLEGLCKELGHHLLVSDSLVRAAPELRPQLRPLGRHVLRGVEDPREIYAGD